jgi:NAD+ kinase
MKPIKSIAFAINTSKVGAEEAASFLAGIANCEGVQTKSFSEYPLPKGALDDQDLCIAIGGDGTLLGILDAALHSGVAVLGVNMGKLGFLATFSQEEVAHDLPEFIKGNYHIAKRSILAGKNKKGQTVHALNDIVLKETKGNSLIRLRVSANGNYVSEYHCDGLIFSTPTGSTAYNLSAGGPIISPELSAIAMTPICPHTFGNRAVIFDDSTRVTIESGQSNPHPRITVDGRARYNDERENLPFEICLASQTLRLMQKSDHSHFEIVRDKLDWGAPAIRESKS